MARAVQRTHVAVALTALIGLSLLVHWLAARRFGGLWIMPDETIYAHRALRLYHEGSLPILGGQGAGYGLLYPVVAGLPLSLGSFATGDAWLKPLQALVVSLAAIPVFVYSRRLMPDAYALVAAALTLASPLLLYSGLVMTEVVFYPVAALALLSVARAVATAHAARPGDRAGADRARDPDPDAGGRVHRCVRGRRGRRRAARARPHAPALVLAGVGAARAGPRRRPRTPGPARRVLDDACSPATRSAPGSA